MNDDLRSRTCTPCRGGVPPLSKTQTESYLEEAPGWALMDDNHRIERTFAFKNFKEALDLVTAIGARSVIRVLGTASGSAWPSARPRGSCRPASR